MKTIRFYIIFGFLILGAACSKKDSGEPDQPVAYKPTPYEIEIPFGFPTELNIPEDNPMTIEGVALGRYLFYDGRLSGRTHPDSLMSCGSCHLQKNSFECGIDHPVYQGHPHGLSGLEAPHVMLPLINLVWNDSGYGWNGIVSKNGSNPEMQNLEDFVWMSVLAPHEINGDTNKTAQLIASIPEYRDLFAKAFGTKDVTMERISKAIAQFIRTLNSSNSKFDRYLKGEEQLNNSELNGFILFTTEEGADCFHCHGGYGNPLFTTHLFYNNGKDSIFTGNFEDPRDRYHITGDPNDLGAYKATTLRNIRFQGPYMHDGRFKTLDDVLKFYNEELKWSPYINPLMHHIADGGTRLTSSELNDVKNFILSLEDSSFLTNPEFSCPTSLPDGSTAFLQR